MSKIIPLRDHIAVERIVEDKTAGGIIIPPSNEKPIIGKVLAVGAGKTLDNGSVREPAVKVGDKVLFGKYAGNEVEIAGKPVVVMREDDILAVVQD